MEGRIVTGKELEGLIAGSLGSTGPRGMTLFGLRMLAARAAAEPVKIYVIDLKKAVSNLILAGDIEFKGTGYRSERLYGAPREGV